jgi:nucleotidyltransferase substrate binding protein (TIGR01987 family)
MNHSYIEFEKVLASLEKALKEKKSDFLRDATIQRFKFCVELAWKTSKKIMGTASQAPRAVIREMAAQQLISDPELWFEFLEAKNLSVHTYKEDLAEKVYSTASRFLPEGLILLAKLKAL